MKIELTLLYVILILHSPGVAFGRRRTGDATRNIAEAFVSDWRTATQTLPVIPARTVTVEPQPTVAAPLVEERPPVQFGSTPLSKINWVFESFQFKSGDICMQGKFYHYCGRYNDNMMQCSIYDSLDASGRLIGVEYIISGAAWNRLPSKEKILWHSWDTAISNNLVGGASISMDEAQEPPVQTAQIGIPTMQLHTQTLPTTMIPQTVPQATISLTEAGYRVVEAERRRLGGVAIPEVLSTPQPLMESASTIPQYQQQPLVATQDEAKAQLAGHYGKIWHTWILEKPTLVSIDSELFGQEASAQPQATSAHAPQQQSKQTLSEQIPLGIPALYWLVTSKDYLNEQLLNQSQLIHANQTSAEPLQKQQQNQQSYLSDSWMRGLHISLEANAKCSLYVHSYKECNASENIFSLNS